jgi:hypothetical protein
MAFEGGLGPFEKLDDVDLPGLLANRLHMRCVSSGFPALCGFVDSFVDYAYVLYIEDFVYGIVGFSSSRLTSIISAFSGLPIFIGVL